MGKSRLVKMEACTVDMVYGEGDGMKVCYPFFVARMTNSLQDLTTLSISVLNSTHLLLVSSSFTDPTQIRFGLT